MNKPLQSEPQETKQRDSASIFRWIASLAILLVVIFLCVAAGLMLLFLWQEQQLKNVTGIDSGQNQLNPFERLYLRTYLASRANDLNQPIGTASETIEFEIEPGQRADQIAANLVEAGLLDDATLFINYLRYHGLDSQLAAGTYQLDSNLSIPELSETLIRAIPREIELQFIEGWRVEEMIEYLDVVRPANIDSEEFRSIVQGQTNSNFSDYGFLTSLPDGASIEGFLFPDSYRIPTDTDAETLIRMMLDNFDQQVTPAMRQAYGVQGLTVYEAVTLASVVQREAVMVEEQPLIAGVYLNRLEQGMRLQADPTVQYALGYQDNSMQWWKSPLNTSDLQIDSPYNTYINHGLPPGPIANPGLDAMNAVAAPEDSDYLYFVADCEADVPGIHVFSLSFEEHLTHVERCR